MSGVGIKRKHLGEKAWREILLRFNASGLGATAFCRREGLAVGSLQRWRERLTRPLAPTLSRPAAAVDVRAPASASSPPAPPPPSPQPRPQTPTTPKFIELGTLGQAGVGPGRLEIKLDLGGGLSLHLVRG